MHNPENKTLSEMVIRLQIQIKNDAFTPQKLIKNEWKNFADRKATLENNTRFGEKVWKLFSAKGVLPQITSKRYLRFSRLTKVPINGPGVPKYHIWKQTFIEQYQIQFFSRRDVPSRIHLGKDGFTPQNLTKILWPNKPRLKTCKPLLHDTKSYSLYTFFFRKFTSKNMILQLPIQLSMWWTSLCELINKNQKQSNLSLTMLKSMSQKRSFAPQTSTQHLIQMLGRSWKPYLIIWDQIHLSP